MMRLSGLVFSCFVAIVMLSSFASAEISLASPSASQQFISFSINSTNITVIANETLGGNITQVNASFPSSICNGASPAQMTGSGPGLWWYDCAINWSAASNSTYVINLTASNGTATNTTTVNFTIDTIAPNITLVALLEPDMFYSDWAGQEIVNVNVTVNGTGSNLLNVSVRLLNQSGSTFMTFNMTNNGTYWWGTFNITNLTTNLTNNQPVYGYGVNVIAFDQAQNVRNSNDQGFNVSVLVHRLGDFQGPPAQFQNCFRESPETTNLSRVSNFNAVNLVQAMMLNGSAACAYNFTGINQSLPWGDTFKSMGKFNFSSVNISTQEQASAVMSAPGQSIQIQIAPPHSFRVSRIYVNSTALAALNTNTTITLYDLPFSSTPVVVNDTGGTGGIVLAWSQGPFNSSFNTSTGNLSITVGGFSGYNISDNSTPTITFNAPTNSSNWANLVNLTINGTGSEVSYATFTLNGSTYQYNYSNSSINTANCSQSSNGSEITNCLLANITLAAGNHTLNVTAYDFGGSSGNSLNSYVSFYNNTAPSVASFTLTNASAGHWFYANATITDLNGGSDVNNYTVNITSGSCAYISQTNTSSTAVFAFNCSGTAGNSTNITINFKDSINQSVNTSTLANTFPNNAPSISAVTISPTAVYNFTNGSCNVTATDSDGDTLTYNYVWYLNGTANVTTQNITTSSYALSNITCQAVANDSYTVSSATNSSASFVLQSSAISFVVNASNTTNSTQSFTYTNSSGNINAVINISNGTTISTPSGYAAGFVFATNFSASSGDLGGSSAFGLNILLGPANSTFSPNITITINYSGLSASVQTSIETANTAGYLRVYKCSDTGGSCSALTPYSVDTTNNLIYVNVSNFSTLGLYDATPATTTTTTTTSSSGSSSGGGAVSGRGVPTSTTPTTVEVPEQPTTPAAQPSAPIQPAKQPEQPFGGMKLPPAQNTPAVQPSAPTQPSSAQEAPSGGGAEGIGFLLVIVVSILLVAGVVYYIVSSSRKK